jgi:hypothetical protein
LIRSALAGGLTPPSLDGSTIKDVFVSLGRLRPSPAGKCWAAQGGCRRLDGAHEAFAGFPAADMVGEVAHDFLPGVLGTF